MDEEHKINQSIKTWSKDRPYLLHITQSVINEYLVDIHGANKRKINKWQQTVSEEICQECSS